MYSALEAQNIKEPKGRKAHKDSTVYRCKGNFFTSLEAATQGNHTVDLFF